MKTKKKLFSILTACAALVLVGCTETSSSLSSSIGGDSSTSINTSSTDSSTPVSSSTEDSSSSSVDEEIVEITKVEINGPTSVYVGSTITLTAGVTGDSENEVDWLSLTPSIASVDENGTVTGLSEGTAFIQATASKDASKYATYEVTVTLRKETPTSLSVTLTGDGVTYDESTNRYNIEVGTSFQIEYKTDVENPIDPYGDGVYYTLLTDDNGVSYEQYVTINRSTGEGSVNIAAEDVVLRVQVAFPISQNNYIYGQASFLTTDTSLDVINSYATKVEEAISLERDNATSSTVRRNRKVVTTSPVYDSNSGTTTYQENVDLINKDITYKYYTDAVYMTETEPYSTTSGSGLTTTYAYSGIQNDGYYNFEYTGSSYSRSVGTVYSKNEAGREDDAALPYNYDASNIYGITGNALTILSEDDYLGLPAFGSEAVRSVMIVKDFSDSVYISASYQTSENEAVAVDLLLGFSADGYLSYYRFNSTILENGEIVSDLSESAEIEYDGEKTSDTSSSNSSHIDVSSLAMSTIYSLTNLYGTTTDQYNFNNDRYNVTFGYNNGSYAASMEPDRAFAFKVNGSGSAALTDFSVSVSNADDYTIVGGAADGSDLTPDEKRPVAVVNEMGEGVFVVNNAFTSDSHYVTGTSTVTISTASSSYSFNVTFTDFGEPTAITITGIYTSTTYSIFENEESTAFRVSVEPSYNSYDLVLNAYDTATNAKVDDALELVSTTSSSLGSVNVYAIKGLKAGSYYFNIGVDGYELTSSNYYINVEEPLSNDTIKENILDTYFVYGSSSSYHTSFYFDSERGKLIITQNNYGVTWTDEIDFTLNNGSITLSGGSAVSGLDGEYVELGTNSSGSASGHYNPTFGYIRTDVPVTLTSSLDSIGLQLTSYGYTYVSTYTISKYTFPQLSNYTFTNGSLYSSGSYTYIDMVINEDNTGGTFTFKSSSSSDATILGTATFDLTTGIYGATITNIVEEGENNITSSWDETISCTVSVSGTYVYFYVTINSSASTTISLTGRPA